MQYTLKDVAKQSGYSIATVSRVLNGNCTVSTKAQAKIWKTVEALNYVPNNAARCLKTNDNKEIALIIPSVTNLFFSSIVTGVEKMLVGQGYSLSIYLNSHFDNRFEVLNNMRGKRIAGMIIAADCISKEIVPLLKSLQEDHIPVVAVDFEPDFSEPFRGVFFDYLQGGMEGASYLLQTGHRKIAYLTMTVDRLSRQRRLEGFRLAMEKFGAAVRADDIFISDKPSGFEAGKELADMMLSSGQPYTAVMVNNDSVAVGVLNELQARGISVPEQISVMGFDDSVFAQMAYPMLTTVRADGESIGKHACELVLAERLGSDAPHNIYLEPKIIVRNSTRPIEQ